MKKIIVPTDLSLIAFNAAKYAVDLAHHVGAAVALLHVSPLPVTDALISFENYEMERDASESLLKKLKEELEQYSKNKVSITFSITTGNFIGAISSINTMDNVFAVVIGSQGVGGAEAFFTGSFARTATHDLKKPLIIIPPDAHFKDIKTVGLACDMKNAEDTVSFSSIHSLLEHFNAKINVLYINADSEKKYVDVLKESHFIQDNLSGYNPEFKLISDKAVIDGINKFINENRLEWLILIPKNRNFIENIFHNSVTQKMLKQPAIPLVMLHQQLKPA